MNRTDSDDSFLHALRNTGCLVNYFACVNVLPWTGLLSIAKALIYAHIIGIQPVES